MGEATCTCIPAVSLPYMYMYVYMYPAGGEARCLSSQAGISGHPHQGQELSCVPGSNH